MHLISTPESRRKLSRSLQLMKGALDILDTLDAPGEIGSMLDLAAARLERFLDRDFQAVIDVQELMTRLDCDAAAISNSEQTPSPWDKPST